MKNISTKLLLLAVSITLTLVSCKKVEPVTPEPTPTLVEKTIIMYCVADNNLAAAINDNVLQVIAAQGVDLEKNNVIVYLDYEKKYVSNPEQTKWIGTTDPQIIRVLPGNKYEIVKTMPEVISSEKIHAKKIFNDIVSMYPAKTYGVIMGSHGDGWAKGADSRSFGGDENPYPKNGVMLNMIDIEDMLPANCEFLMFDACQCADVESSYIFRNKVTNFLASVYLTPSYGVDYRNAIPKLISGDYKGMIDAYYKKYADNNGEVSFSLIKPAKINELAAEQKRMLKAVGATYDDIKAAMTSTDKKNPNTVQMLTWMHYNRQYDYVDLMTTIAKYMGKENEVEPLLALFKEIMVYEKHTDKYVMKPIDQYGHMGDNYDIATARTNCGLSTYMPVCPEFTRTDYWWILAEQFDYYITMPWYKAAGLDMIFTEWSYPRE